MDFLGKMLDVHGFSKEKWADVPGKIMGKKTTDSYHFLRSRVVSYGLYRKGVRGKQYRTLRTWGATHPARDQLQKWIA